MSAYEMTTEAPIQIATLDGLVAEILEETDYLANPFFEALRGGAMSREAFVETQRQFYFAVVFFSRPMATLAARIPTAAQRLEILRNVWEEHGEGDLHFHHGNTFLELLFRLDGLTAAEVRSTPLGAEVSAFNAALAGAAVADDFLFGLATLGIIERMFADISAEIGSGVVARGWLPPEQMIHYGLHETLDVRHADDFFDVLRAYWDDEERRPAVEQGLRLGAYVFDRLYLGLWERSRR